MEEEGSLALLEGKDGMASQAMSGICGGVQGCVGASWVEKEEEEGFPGRAGGTV